MTPGNGLILAVSGLTGLLVGTILALTQVNTVVADIEYDWLVARAAVADDAYRPIKDLAASEGVEIRIVRPLDGSPSVHPRTPGALLVMIPLGLVPFSLLVPFATTISVSIWSAFCMLWLRQTRLRGSRRLLLLLVATCGAPIMMTFAFAGQGLVIGALMFAAWHHGVSGRARIWPGVALAAAAVLKVFPGVLL
ncbi:MAG TPA: glycosyltransferase 87 family protein, partial [Acidimicrobiia bacterium]